MHQFADGFSSQLTEVAKQHRPLHTDLSLDQCRQLADMVGYQFVPQQDFPFTIYHPDGKHGLDSGLKVIWLVDASGRKLIYHPMIQSQYMRGNDFSIIGGMEEVLSTQLPRLGFQERIMIDLPESVVHLPKDLSDPDDVSVMFVSEFKARYLPLYDFLKRIFEKC